jgi:hypothetical protein
MESTFRTALDNASKGKDLTTEQQALFIEAELPSIKGLSGGLILVSNNKFEQAVRVTSAACTHQPELGTQVKLTIKGTAIKHLAYHWKDAQGVSEWAKLQSTLYNKIYNSPPFTESCVQLTEESPLLHQINTVDYAIGIHPHPSTSIHIHSHPSTSIHIHPHPFTSIHIHSHPFTSIHIHPYTPALPVESASRTKRSIHLNISHPRNHHALLSYCSCTAPALLLHCTAPALLLHSLAMPALPNFPICLHLSILLVRTAQRPSHSPQDRLPDNPSTRC